MQCLNQLGSLIVLAALNLAKRANHRCAPIGCEFADGFALSFETEAARRLARR
jgi:hypothetical protein